MAGPDSAFPLVSSQIIVHHPFFHCALSCLPLSFSKGQRMFEVVCIISDGDSALPPLLISQHSPFMLSLFVLPVSVKTQLHTVHH